MSRSQVSGVTLGTCGIRSSPARVRHVPRLGEMQVTSFDDRELDILILAIRYWKAHRGTSARRTDPEIRATDVDALLAKLQSGRSLQGLGMPEFQEENGF